MDIPKPVSEKGGDESSSVALTLVGKRSSVDKIGIPELRRDNNEPTVSSNYNPPNSNDDEECAEYVRKSERSNKGKNFRLEKDFLMLPMGKKTRTKKAKL